MKKIICIIISALLVVSVPIGAQNNTSSPYTRYGYGLVSDAGFGQVKAMGGLSMGVRSKNFINPANPASYTSVDSLNFRLEAGVSFQVSMFSDGAKKQTALDGNLECLAMQFPIKKWVAFSLGLMPYSIVGYNYSMQEVVSSSITAGNLMTNYTYNGEGGITQLYAGLGFRPFSWFSLGANLQFYFGSIQYSSTASFNEVYVPTIMEREIAITDLSGNFGVQFSIPIQRKYSLTLGGTYQLKSNVRAEAQQSIITTDTVIQNFNNSFDFPMGFGTGFVFNYLDRLSIGFDYKKEFWSDVEFFGEKEFVDRNKFIMGVEFLPNPNGRAYFERVYYRFGANISKSYYQVNGEQLNSLVLTTGWGFPLKKGLNPTIMNFTFEYGLNGKIENNLLKEQYFKFILNATINENWFMKRKLN